MTKTIKQIGLFSFAFALLLVLAVVFTACGKQPEQQVEKFTVTFYYQTANGTNEVFTTAEVKKGNRVSAPNPLAPNFGDDSKVFTGWFKDDQTFLQEWDFSVDQVKENLNLYAGFRTITLCPSAVKMADESCTSKITWTQKNITAGSYTVKITDENGTETTLLGTTSFDSNSFVVTFTPQSIPQGGIYSVSISDSERTEAPATAQDLKFCGAGTESNPYLIFSSADFDKIRTNNVTQGTFFKLQSDITVSTNIAEQNVTFNGNFFGNGYTINLENSNTAPFTEIGANGIVSTVTISGDITSDTDSLGAVANINRGTVEKATIFANVTGTSGNVGLLGLSAVLSTQENRGIAGGVVGTNFGLVRNCKIVTTTSSDGVVKAKIAGGCIVGLNETIGIVEKCVSQGCLGAWNSKETGNSLSNYSYSGGVVGINKGIVKESCLEGSGKVLAQRCSDETQVVAGSNNIALGGIVGYNMEGGQIEKCYYSGIRVHGDESVGGIAGINAGSIKYCISEGIAHSSTGISYVGGRCDVGGIVGTMVLNANNEPVGTVENSFSTVNVYAYGNNAKAWSSAAYVLSSPYMLANPDEKSGTAILLAPSASNSQTLVATKDANGNMVVGETYAEQLNGTLTTNKPFVYDTSAKTVKLNITKDAEQTTQVELYDGLTLSATETIDETGKTLSLFKSGYHLDGWAIVAGGEVVYPATTVFNYYKLTNEKITKLYAVFSEVQVAEEDLVIIVHIGTSETSTNPYFTEALTQSVLEGFLAENPDINITTRIETFAGTVVPFGEYVRSGYYDIILGAGNNVTSTGGVTAITKVNLNTSPIQEVVNFVTAQGSARYGCLLTNRPWAQKFFAYVTGLESTTAEVTLVVNNTPTTYEVNEVLSKTIDMSKITITPPQDHTFAGWSSDQNATEADIDSSVAKIAYANVKNLLSSQNKVTLYPVFNQEQIDIEISVWGRWITEAQAESIVDAFKALDGNSELKIKTNYYDDANYHGLDAFKAAVSTSTEIVLGSNGSTYAEEDRVATAVLLSSFNISGNRHATLLKDTNSLAVAFYCFATGVSNEDVSVTFKDADENTLSTVTVNEFKGTTGTVPTAPEVSNKTFAGWATDKTATEVDVASTLSTISYANIKTLVTGTSLTLYAIYLENAPVTKPTLNISAWTNWISKEQVDPIIPGFLTSIGLTADDLDVVVTDTAGTKVADVAGNTPTTADVIVGNAKNMGGLSAKGRASIDTNVLDFTRQVALLDDTNEYAIAFFLYLTTNVAQVTFVNGEDIVKIGFVSYIASDDIRSLSSLPSPTAPEGKTFAGWGLSADATEVVLASDATELTYATASAYSTFANKKVTLYAIFVDA